MGRDAGCGSPSGGLLAADRSGPLGSTLFLSPARISSPWAMFEATIMGRRPLPFRLVKDR